MPLRPKNMKPSNVEPRLTLSCAVSSDGYLDDLTPERAILSSAEDLEAVLALRAQMDMIVIGAETLRRDNPSLATRGASHFEAREKAGRAADPVKVVISQSGNIPTNRAFFETGRGEKIVLSQRPTDAPGTHVALEGDPINAVLRLARERNLSDILIEGGAQILRLALPRADHFRLAVSPKTLGETGHARLFEDVQGFLNQHPDISMDFFGDTRVYHIDLTRSRMRALMDQAFTLSEQCPSSTTAFAVGAIGCTEDLTVLATGYSRETGPSDHAEEALLSKLDGPPHTVICTLEPCLTRASKSTGCAERLVRAGVSRVVYAIAEDETFTRQSGLTHLKSHNIDLIHLPGYEERFRRVNAAIYGET